MGYKTNPHDILGIPEQERWSWRRMLVFSQVINRRIDRQNKAQQAQQDRGDMQAAAKAYAAQLEAALHD